MARRSLKLSEQSCLSKLINKQRCVFLGLNMQPDWLSTAMLKGRRLSCPRITQADHKINRLTLSARILQPTFIVDWPIRQATVGNILASRISRVVLWAFPKVSSQSLIWAGQMSSQGMVSSFPCFLTDGASPAVLERFAAGVNPEAISETTIS